MSEVKKMKASDGSIIHYLDGKMHNWDGPAYIPQGNKRAAEYYLFGIRHTKDQWLDKKKKKITYLQNYWNHYELMVVIFTN